MLRGVVLVWTVTAVVAGSCTSGSVAQPSASPTVSRATAASQPASQSTTPTVAPSPDSFTVTAGDQEIAVTCRGEATDQPTILLMHGNGAGGTGQFAAVEPHLRTLSRVCDYDRPGTGRSAPASRVPRPITDLVTEAHDVIEAAGIATPVFLLGTSEGAGLAMLYAQAYPDDVAGFVAINPPPPYDAWMAEAVKVETPEEVATIEEPDYRGDNGEQIDRRPNSSLLTDALPDDLPYAVIFDEDCGGDAAFCGKVFEPLEALSRRLAEVGAGGRFVPVPGAGHHVEQTRPREVERVVDDVWREATD